MQSVSDQEVVLVANRNYWHGGPPRVDQVTLVDTPAPGGQLRLLRQGMFDILLAASPDDFREAQADPSLAADKYASIQLPNLTVLQGTTGPDGGSLPENDAFVAAVKYAINYDKIADLFGGWGDGVFPAQSGLIPSICGYSNDLTAYYTHDPSRARELLTQAGYPAGLDIEFPYWTGSWGGVDTAAVARAIQRDLQEVGIRPRLTAHTGEEYFSLLFDQRTLTGMTLSMSIYQVPDPEDVLRRKMSYLNLTGRELDAEAALDAAAAEPDWRRRAQRYRALQLRFLQTAPMIFLLSYPHRVVRRRSVVGYEQAPYRPGPRLSQLNVRSEPSGSR